ncbi:MAG: hypothetical protein JWL81_1185 [Verrucomicrobiales bacterium]|nr:hypothetical protein [Verrucomicrobiales bacterium]
MLFHDRVTPPDTCRQSGRPAGAAFRAAAAKTGCEFVPLTEYCLRATQTLGREAVYRD